MCVCARISLLPGDYIVEAIAAEIGLLFPLCKGASECLCVSSFLVFRGSPSFFSFFVPLGSAQLSGVVEVVNGGWGQTDGNQ